MRALAGYMRERRRRKEGREEWEATKWREGKGGVEGGKGEREGKSGGGAERREGRQEWERMEGRGGKGGVEEERVRRDSCSLPCYSYSHVGPVCTVKAH